MRNDTIIRCHDVGKRFVLRERSDHTVLSRIARRMRGVPPRAVDTLWAIRHANLHIQRGEIVGIVGDNASGKSTLLRLLAGIYRPDEGTVDVRGRVTALIELGAGLVHRLSVRDNILLACSLLGMDRMQAKRAFPAIVDFAKLERHLDACLYQLSRGQQQRLAFAAVVHCDPEILLLDEALSVGDVHFRATADAALRTVFATGVTGVIVSHALPELQQLCNRLLWVERGRIRADGPPDDIVRQYAAANAALGTDGDRV